MGRGGKENNKTQLKDRFVLVEADLLPAISRDEYNRIELKVLNEEAQNTRNCLLGSFNELNKTLGRDDKVKNEGLHELALRIGGMVDVVCGLLRYSDGRREEVLKVLGGTKEAYDPDVLAAREARYKIQLNEIIVRCLENKLKEKSG